MDNLIKVTNNELGTITATLAADEVASLHLTPVPDKAPGIIVLSPGTSEEEHIYYESKDAESGIVSGLVRDISNLNGGAGREHVNGTPWETMIVAEYFNKMIDMLNLEHNQDGTHKGDLVTTLKATGAEIGSGVEDAKIVTPKSILDSYLSNQYIGMARQAIMNGNFDIWQRGTSSAVADATVIFKADRWYDYVSKDGGTLPTLTRSRQLFTSGDIPNSFYYTRLATNGAGTSLGVNSEGHFIQRIENGVRNLCGAGKQVTVSFWARSDIANKRICPTLRSNYGSGGSPSTPEYIQGTPITLTATWTKYTATFTTNTLAGKTFGTAGDDYLELNLFYMWGSTLGDIRVQTGVTAETFVGAGNIDIAQVQLCSGDVALPFQPKSQGEELSACQRYYETGQTVGAPRSSDNVAIGAINYKASKRALPTLTYSSAPGGTEFADQHGFGWFKASSASTPVKFTWYATAEL
jgi:hypothetical protein